MNKPCTCGDGKHTGINELCPIHGNNDARNRMKEGMQSINSNNFNTDFSEGEHLTHPTKEGIEYMANVGIQQQLNADAGTHRQGEAKWNPETKEGTYSDKIHGGEMKVKSILDQYESSESVIKRLQANVDSLKQMFEVAQQNIERLTLERDIAQGRNRELLEALKWYADTGNYCANFPSGELVLRPTYNKQESLGMKATNALNNQPFNPSPSKKD